MSLFQRGKKGTWWARFRYDGQPYCFSLGTTDKVLAHDILAQKKHELVLAKHGWAKPEKEKREELSFDAAAERYLEEYKLSRKPRSYERHCVTYRALLPSFRRKKLAEIHTEDLATHKTKRLNAGLAMATVNHELKFMRALFNWGKKRGYVDDNPVSGSGLVEKENNGTHRYLEETEVKWLLAQCKGPLKPLVIAALETGFRADELRNLKWRQVDFKQGKVICLSIYAKNGETCSVPLSKKLHETLLPLRRGRQLDDAVFQSRLGTPYRDWRSAFTAAVKKAGLEGVVFHTLRHTFITRCAKGIGVDAAVQKLARHEDQTMIRRYTHLSEHFIDREFRKVFDKPDEPELVRPTKRRAISLEI